MWGDLGVLLGLVILIVLALRGVNMLVASLLAAAVVAVTNGQSLFQALYLDFATGMMDIAGQYLLLFLAGAIFGRVIEEGHAATKIALVLTRWLGSERVLWITMTAASLLTYAGVSVFVIVFTMYPLCLGMMRRANLPRKLFLGALLLGPGTFVTTALPGSPSVHNNLSATTLGTSLSAGWGLGLFASLIMVVLGMGYLEWGRKQAIRQGVGFDPVSAEDVQVEAIVPGDLPSPMRAFTPPLVVILVILVPQLAAGMPGAYFPLSTGTGRLLHFATGQPLAWTCVAMFAGSLAGLLLYRSQIPSPLATLTLGAERCPMPLFNWAAVIGFGAVVKSTHVFQQFAEALIHADINPLVSMVLATNVFAGVVGSASGGLALFYESLWPLYGETGIPLPVIHRLVTIASGGLDSLPHSGALITTMTVMHITHRQGYGTAFVITLVVPLIALAVVTAAALLLL